jgi:hypothetical protein
MVVAMELLIESQTVEPFIQQPVRRTAPAVAQPPLLSRLELHRPGRALLSCMRWGIVFGLVLSGFIGAEMLSRGINLVRDNPGNAGQPLLATTDSRH